MGVVNVSARLEFELETTGVLFFIYIIRSCTELILCNFSLFLFFFFFAFYYLLITEIQKNITLNSKVNQQNNYGHIFLSPKKESLIKNNRKENKTM